jgi:carbon storage regulator
MLILSRKTGESIVIDGRITVKIVRVDGEQVKLGIVAPAEVPVHRQEVYIEIQRSNQEAMTHTRAKLPRLAAPGESLATSNGTSADADSLAFPLPFASRTVEPTALL